MIAQHGELYNVGHCKSRLTQEAIMSEIMYKKYPPNNKCVLIKRPLDCLLLLLTVLGPASCCLLGFTLVFPKTGDADFTVDFTFLERVSLVVRLVTAGLTSSTELD